MLQCIIPASAIEYCQPFESGEQNSQTYRIPSIITLKNGSVMSAADMRYSHGSDSPNNIDTCVAISCDGLNTWDYNRVNYFDDYADGTSDSGSASFIDSSLVQSSETSRIFLIDDAFPSGIGYNQSVKGTGYRTDCDGTLRLALSNKGSKNFRDYSYLVGDFKNGYAKISGTDKNYTVDEEYFLYLDGKPLYTSQVNSNKSIKQNIFYFSSDLHVFPTSYLWLRYSDDNGITWSKPEILNSQVKNSDEAFLGICPGRGAITQVDGHERILFCVYDNKGITENTSTIYSDNNGASWNRGKRIKYRVALNKTSESQIVSYPDGTLHMFSRNASNYIASCVSKDAGVTWSTMKAEKSLSGNANCMVSVINTGKEVDGKSVILASFPSDTESRADGVIKTGLVDKDGTTEWTQTYHINSGFFAYSCLTVLPNSNIACLYEDEASHINYKVLSINQKGKLSDINGNDIDYVTQSQTVFEKIKSMLENIAFFLHIL